MLWARVRPGLVRFYRAGVWTTIPLTILSGLGRCLWRLLAVGGSRCRLLIGRCFFGLGRLAARLAASRHAAAKERAANGYRHLRAHHSRYTPCDGVGHLFRHIPHAVDGLRDLNRLAHPVRNLLHALFRH